MSDPKPTPIPRPDPMVVAQPVPPEDPLEADYVDKGIIAERVVYVEVFPL